MPTLPPMFWSILLTTTVLCAVSLKEQRPHYLPPTLLFFGESCCAWSLGAWVESARRWATPATLTKPPRQTRAGARLVASLGTPHSGPWQSLVLASAKYTVYATDHMRSSALLGCLGTPHSDLWVGPCRCLAYLKLQTKTPACQNFRRVGPVQPQLPNLDRPCGTQAQRRGEAMIDNCLV